MKGSVLVGAMRELGIESFAHGSYLSLISVPTSYSYLDAADGKRDGLRQWNHELVFVQRSSGASSVEPIEEASAVLSMMCRCCLRGLLLAWGVYPYLAVNPEK